VPKHPLYPIEGLLRLVMPALHKQVFEEDSSLVNFKDDNNELADEDDDVKVERKFVSALPFSQYQNFPLVAKDIRKVYPSVLGPKVANKQISLRVNPGELFGLLGPNGAGKTTLISQLIGMTPPTRGSAWINGFDIKRNLEIVQLMIGVCPQFDILWPELTVEEHLFFYARLKGIDSHEEQERVTRALQEVQLSQERRVMTSELPLGMKRRLSIAISLVSAPKIIFLDEPTTGLDPDTRR